MIYGLWLWSGLWFMVMSQNLPSKLSFQEKCSKEYISFMSGTQLNGISIGFRAYSHVLCLVTERYFVNHFKDISLWCHFHLITSLLLRQPSTIFGSSLEVVFSIFSQDKTFQADNQRHLRGELEMTQSRTMICLASVGHADLLWGCSHSSWLSDTRYLWETIFLSYTGISNSQNNRSIICYLVFVCVVYIQHIMPHVLERW